MRATGATTATPQTDNTGPYCLVIYDHNHVPPQTDGTSDNQPHFTTLDLGIDRYNEAVAARTERDHALNSSQLPILQRPKPLKGTEEACAAWDKFSETTDEKDHDAMAKGDLHGGQLHRLNRAAVRPIADSHRVTIPNPDWARPIDAPATARALTTSRAPTTSRALAAARAPAAARGPAAARAPVAWNKGMLAAPVIRKKKTWVHRTQWDKSMLATSEEFMESVRATMGDARTS
ncbi:hypothetical protein AOQ84DRAFT_306091 [Glonium stellatum]|uniref:Uncharacterized protein n=1 Tax=Glonium stellatum TaxID=574774 RepID=A0A8E2ENH8_9PEZI|nr:hypothetical protein AOQ84DRAFT_306091 [Glonium stellatum]